MPKLMEKEDWMQTMADVGSAENVWYENVSAEGGFFPLSMPESGMYRVILVKVGNGSSTVRPRHKSAHDYIGYCRKNYNGHCTTAEIMKELREGEAIGDADNL